MGEFTLGCLLGQYDKAQSFDVGSKTAATNVGSWKVGVGSISLQGPGASPASWVHSSGQGLRHDVTSIGAGFTCVSYSHGVANDAHARWFPEVTTHAARVDFWARMYLGVYSGGVYQDFGDVPGEGTVYVPAAFPLTAMRNAAANVTSATGLTVRFIRAFAVSSDVRWHLDDVLTQIDPVTLHPEYQFLEQARVNASQHRSRTGHLYDYRWSGHFAYRVPLQLLPDSHADLINWWWQQGLNLAFTLDTSDAESIRIVRIVNERQPIGMRVRPYDDLWQGVLELESLDAGSLVF